MKVPAPTTWPIQCARCSAQATFYIPYEMLFLAEEEIDELEDAMQNYPHRLYLERLDDRQVLWYFLRFYSGPWNGWDCNDGVCICRPCGWQGKCQYS